MTLMGLSTRSWDETAHWVAIEPLLLNFHSMVVPISGEADEEELSCEGSLSLRLTLNCEVETYSVDSFMTSDMGVLLVVMFGTIPIRSNSPVFVLI